MNKSFTELTTEEMLYTDGGCKRYYAPRFYSPCYYIRPSYGVFGRYW